MGYTAFYRKFRPTRFDEIVGQEHITKTLKNQIISNRVGHAYLFNGGRGTGKTSAAKLLARAINCLNPQDGEPCNECEICKAALDGSLTDIVEMDAASNNSVEDIREIREAVNFLPTKAKYRVYIIDEVHMLSTGAFNALLKTLEEPPAHVKFILATTEPQKIPATILSRCQRFDFKRISQEDIIKRLKIVCKESKIQITDGAMNLIASLSEGAMRDALSILERCTQDNDDNIDETKIRDLVGIPKSTYINKVVKSIIEFDTAESLETIDEILKDGKDLNNLIWEIIKYVKDVLLYKSTGKAELYNNEEIEEIKEISEKVEKERLINLICELSEIENKMKLSTQKLIIFQTGIIKLCNNIEINSQKNNDEKSSDNYSNLASRITRIENYLRNNNVVTVKKEPTYTQVNANEEKKSIPKPEKPKYEGKPQEFWPNVVNQFKEQGKMFMYINLAGTIAKEVNDMTLAIEFPNGINSFAKDFLERPENKINLKNTIQMATGKDMQIKFIDTKPEINNNSESGFESFANNLQIPFNVIE